MVLYYNTVRVDGNNTDYPYKMEILGKEDLEEVMRYDHMCAECKENHRKKENFISADCSMFDVDNTDSDDPKKWTTPEDVQNAFPDVMFFVSYSRNHMKRKGGRAPRPKFHVYFPDVTYTDMSKYSKHKGKVCQYFTAFDPQAKDAVRVFYGVEQPKVDYFSGSRRLSEFMETVTIPTRSEDKRADKHTANRTGIIPEGKRNATLFKIAMNIRRTKGDGENAFQSFLRESERCSPPLERKEIDGVWKSALTYSISNKRTDKTYAASNSFKPQEFTDVGQAKVFKGKVRESVRYSPATGYLFFNGKVWKEDALKVQKMVQKLTDKQLEEARLQLQEAQRKEDEAVVSGNKECERSAKGEIRQATQYRKCALAYTLVWDYIQDKLIHLTNTPFALSATIFDSKVVNIYLVQYWGHPADLWYSAAPLELIDSGYEPDLVPLTMPLDESVKSSDCCEVCQKNGELVFRAGVQEQCIDKLPNI